MDLDSVDQVLRTTRSVRRRIDFDRPIEAGVIEECIEIATQAPTGANQESWRFLVLTDPEPKHEVAELYRSALAQSLVLPALHGRLCERCVAHPDAVRSICESRLLSGLLLDTRHEPYT